MCIDPHCNSMGATPARYYNLSPANICFNIYPLLYSTYKSGWLYIYVFNAIDISLLIYRLYYT